MLSASKSGQFGGYTISRSSRFRAGASAYYSRTFGTPTNNLKWSYSLWFKKGVMNAGSLLSNIGAGTGVANTFQYLIFDFNGSQGGQLEWRQVNSVGSITAERQPTMLLRDPSAWYHILCVWDSANATAADRMIMYVNGVRVTSFTASTDPSSSLTSYINTASWQHLIGACNLNGLGQYLDGYMTEVNFVDGQALTPSSFGQYNAYGVWTPTKYNGTYGNNGFYLNFSDNSGATATTIGKDYSGNGNNWTPNNISVTSGVTYDSMIDVPTLWGDGSTNRGNYATLNPLQKGSVITVSAANLQFASSSGNSYCPSTIGATNGKWYCEVFITSASTAAMVGIVNENASLASYPGGNTNGYGYYRDGQKYTNGAGSAYGNSYTDNDIIGIALDLDNGKVWFSKNGTWQASGDPAAGTNAAFTGISTTNTWFFACGNSGVTTQNANFGQRPFSYTPPTGFKALNTFNLPAPTIGNGANYMAATTYTATGSTPQTINNGTNNTTGTTFKPDLVWTKSRSAVFNNVLNDSVRGAQYYLYSNLTNAEANDATYLTAFNSNGFSLGTGNFTNGTTMVGWQWQAGAGTTSSNTSGSITSTVSVNATAGFSVVAYNSGASGDKTVGHGLGFAPSMIITKSRSSASYNWVIYHASVATTVKKYLPFTTDGLQDNGSNIWGSAFPTSSVFGITSGNGVVASTDCIAYCWAAVDGYSAFGKYTGNGSADGPFVYCGFRPRYVLIKRTDSSPYNWVIGDTSRNTYNVANAQLSANTTDAENTSYMLIDFVSNGLKFRTTDGAYNASGGTYVYAAFAENPFKYSNAR